MEQLPMLGVQPALGRLFARDDDRPEANATVVLSWGLWKRRYAGNPSIIGHTIFVDLKPYTVIGVLPAWFRYPKAPRNCGCRFITSGPGAIHAGFWLAQL